MVGGRVIELRDDVVCGQNVRRVWCMDRNGDECAIYVARPDADRVAIGDQVWWQGRNAYWTAPGGKEDVPLSRIGFSFDPMKQ